MAINTAQIINSSVIFIRNLINDNVTDPLSRSKWVYTSYPQREVVYPIITVKRDDFSAQTQYIDSESKLVNISLEIRIWARNIKEKDTISDDVFNIMRTMQKGASGTILEGLHNFKFEFIADVDEPEGKGGVKSCIWRARFLVAAV